MGSFLTQLLYFQAKSWSGPTITFIFDRKEGETKIPIPTSRFCCVQLFVNRSGRFSCGSGFPTAEFSRGTEVGIQNWFFCGGFRKNLTVFFIMYKKTRPRRDDHEVVRQLWYVYKIVPWYDSWGTSLTLILYVFCNFNNYWLLIIFYCFSLLFRHYDNILLLKCWNIVNNDKTFSVLYGTTW